MVPDSREKQPYPTLGVGAILSAQSNHYVVRSGNARQRLAGNGPILTTLPWATLAPTRGWERKLGRPGSVVERLQDREASHGVQSGTPPARLRNGPGPSHHPPCESPRLERKGIIQLAALFVSHRVTSVATGSAREQLAEEGLGVLLDTEISFGPGSSYSCKPRWSAAKQDRRGTRLPALANDKKIACNQKKLSMDGDGTFPQSCFPDHPFGHLRVTPPPP